MRRRLIIVSNRVPNPLDKQPRSGGLAVALEEALKSNDAIWFGWTGVISEAVETKPQLLTKRNVTFARLNLTRDEHARYYRGFANSCMFPLLLYRADLMTYRRDDHRGYLAVCDRFAKVLKPMIQAGDLIWVHDNHLLSIVRNLRQAGVRNKAGFFLHIPFPPFALFQVLPCAAEILADLLTYDVIGFQTDLDKQNFLGAVRGFRLAQIVSDSEIRTGQRKIRVLHQPVGIQPTDFARMAQKAVTDEMTLRLRGSPDERQIIIAAERLDYSKGINLRLSAFARFIGSNPEFQKKVSLLQIAAGSRQDVEDYRKLKQGLDEQVGAINGQFAEFDWVPIRYITRSVARRVLAGLFRASPVGLVTPVRDGFNLVSAEYVAAQDPANPGVLILSKFAGAAATLEGAQTVNPHDVDEVAQTIRQALTMPLAERQERWTTMMQAITAYSAAAWCHAFIAAFDHSTDEGRATQRLRFSA